MSWLDVESIVTVPATISLDDGPSVGLAVCNSSIELVPSLVDAAPKLSVSVVELDCSAKFPLFSVPLSAADENSVLEPDNVDVAALGSAALLVAFSGGGVVTRSKLKHCPGV